MTLGRQCRYGTLQWFRYYRGNDGAGPGPWESLKVSPQPRIKATTEIPKVPSTQLSHPRLITLQRRRTKLTCTIAHIQKSSCAPSSRTIETTFQFSYRAARHVQWNSMLNPRQSNKARLFCCSTAVLSSARQPTTGPPRVAVLYQAIEPPVAL